VLKYLTLRSDNTAHDSIPSDSIQKNEGNGKMRIKQVTKSLTNNTKERIASIKVVGITSENHCQSGTTHIENSTRRKGIYGYIQGRCT
jgi:hypothetical protein